MEAKPEKQKTLGRLALCVILAAGLYAVLDQFGGAVPQLEPCRPWLRENKVQAIAIGAAVLFGASLLLFPLGEEERFVPPPEEDACDPCDGYEQVCDLS